MAASVREEGDPGAARVFVVPTALDLARAVAGRLCGIVRERAGAARGGEGGRPVVVALSGGTTPRRAYELLAAEPYLGLFPWDIVRFCQVDERWVPRESPDSNRGMLEAALFSRAPVPDENVCLVDTTLPGPAEGARRYESDLRRVFPEAGGGFPRFDAVVLGIGRDGHTASLFPGSPALSERAAWATATAGGAPPLARITLTLPVLNAARQVVFAVAGGEKADVLSEVLLGRRGKEPLPAARVAPPRGAVTIVADAAAASRLPKARKEERK